MTYWERHRLRQGKEDFTAFHNKFTCIIRKLKINDEDKRNVLEQHITEDLKAAMVGVMEDVTTYPQFVRVLQRLNDQMKTYMEGKAGRRMGSILAHPRAIPSNPAPHPSFSPGGVVPMDLFALRNSATARPAQQQK